MVEPEISFHLFDKIVIDTEYRVVIDVKAGTFTLGMFEALLVVSA